MEAGAEPPTSVRGDYNREIRALNSAIAEHAELGRQIAGAKQAVVQVAKVGGRALYETWQAERAAARQLEEERQKQQRKAEQERAEARGRAARGNELGKGRGR